VSTTGGAVWGSFQWGAGSPGGTVTPGVPLQNMVLDAYRIAGITLMPQVTPNIEKMNEALPMFNRLVGSWNSGGGLKIFTINISIFPQIAGKGTSENPYTIGGPGLGADWDAPRPQFWAKANIIFPTNPPVRRDIQIVDDIQWGSIQLTNIPGAPPWALYPDMGFPITRVYTTPQPTAGYQFEFYTWQALPYAQTLGDLIVLPDGYEQALVFTLAEMIAARNPAIQNMAPESRLEARKARYALNVQNTQSRRLVPSEWTGRQGTWVNWRTGLYD